MFKLESIADRTITEADIDNDGKISFDEFCRVIFNFLLCEEINVPVLCVWGIHSKKLKNPFHLVLWRKFLRPEL